MNDYSVSSSKVDTVSDENVVLPLTSVTASSSVVLELSILGRSSNATYDSTIRATIERLGSALAKTDNVSTQNHVGGSHASVSVSNNQISLIIHGVKATPVTWVIICTQTKNGA